MQAADRPSVCDQAERVFVIANNDIGGKAVVNALQMAALLGDDRRQALGLWIRKHIKLAVAAASEYVSKPDCS